LLRLWPIERTRFEGKELLDVLDFEFGEVEEEMLSGRPAETTTIADRVASAVEQQAAKQMVTDVRIGLGYTAVDTAWIR